MTVGFPWWKHLLLNAYYYGTLPARHRASRGLARRGTLPVVVLFYHRVSDRVANDWTIANRQFDRQIAWLERRFDLVSLPEAQRRLREGHHGRMSVSITFDDGYADNCDVALPLLIRKQIPVTYFVCTDQALRRQPFPHDAAAGHPLPPNTLEQLRQLAAAGVEIGAHTRTHTDLGKIVDQTKLADEIVGSREELQHAIGCPVRYFSFPYGLPANLNPDGVRMARAAGYEGVCSAYGGYNFPGDDTFHLRRVHADPHFIRFKNWLTMDPRRLTDPGRRTGVVV